MKKIDAGIEEHGFKITPPSEEDKEEASVLVVWYTKKTENKTNITLQKHKLWSNEEPTSIKLDPKDTVVHAWCGPGKGMLQDYSRLVTFAGCCLSSAHGFFKQLKCTHTAARTLTRICWF